MSKPIKLLRVKEAATAMGVLPATLRDLDRRGILPAIRDWAGHRRFREDLVKDFKEKLLRGEMAPREQESRGPR